METNKSIEVDLDSRRVASNSGERNCDFHGELMRIAASPQPPFVDCFQDFYGDWSCNGSNVEVLDHLSKQTNFKIKWVVLANNHQEQQQQQSVSDQSSIINLVSSGRALMSANGLIALRSRQKLNVIFSQPFDSFKIHFLLSKSVHDHDHIFIKPFNSGAWLAILLSAFVIVPVFYVINRTSYYYFLLDDKFLHSELPMGKCLRYCVKNSYQKILKFRKISTTSPSTSFDLLIGNQVDELIAFENSTSLINNISHINSTSYKTEERRQKKLFLKQFNLNRKSLKKLSRLQRKAGFSKLPYIVWYVVSSLANQGGETEDLPLANSTRILVAFWWLYLIVVVSIHSGILTAILTFPKQLDFIQTLDDYLALNDHEKSHLRLTIDKYSELAHLFSEKTNLYRTSLQRLDESLINLVDFSRHRQRILDDIHSGQAAFLEEKSLVNLIITREYLDSNSMKCQFKSSRYALDIIPMSFILSKNLSKTCLLRFNSILKRVMQTGLAQKWRRKYEPQGNDCLNTVVINAGDVNKIELKHVVLGFWLLVGGLLTGALSLIIEVVWLFTVDIDDDDGDPDSDQSKRDSTSSSSSTYSSSSSSMSELRLGHRNRILSKRPIKSLDGKIKMKKLIKINGGDKRIAPALPSTASIHLHDPGLRESLIGPESLLELRETIKLDKKQKRLAKISEKRSKRVKRTLDLFKKLHEGRIYSGSRVLLNKVSNQVHRKSRRSIRPIQRDEEATKKEAPQSRRRRLTRFALFSTSTSSVRPAD